MSIITLDDAIRIHLANQKKYLLSIISGDVWHPTEIHIGVFEQTPSDTKVIERLIKQKEKDYDQACNALTTERVWTELQALEDLLSMFRRHERGEDLSVVPY